MDICGIYKQQQQQQLEMWYHHHYHKIMDKTHRGPYSGLMMMMMMMTMVNGLGKSRIFGKKTAKIDIECKSLPNTQTEWVNFDMNRKKTKKTIMLIGNELKKNFLSSHVVT